jgi:glutathione-regulated potassium-efflux system ancillary protein KefG
VEVVPDLVDAREVAAMLNLKHPNSVSTYLKRYEDFPSPVYGPGPGHARVWLRLDIERWREERHAGRRSGARR